MSLIPTLLVFRQAPYGFSNNPKITFGPPNFKQASFDFSVLHQDIEIVLK